MSRLTAITAAAKGIASGFRQWWCAHQEIMEAYRRMDRAQQESAGAIRLSTKMLKDLEGQAKLAKEIESEVKDRLE